MKRSSGILMPISSLPSPHGIGTFGKAAYAFADFLHAAGQAYWQVLPLGPTGYGDSPYQSFSTFAGNPYFIDLDMLKEALEAGADIIMLDNMNVEDMKKAVELCRGKAETECSGNVTRENVAKLVDIGVDYISSGALTHSSPILDLSLKNLHAI